MTGKKLWNKNYILVLTVCALAAFTHNAFTTMFPIYVLDIGGSNKDTGLMMAALTVAGMVTRLFAGRLIDSWGRKKTFVLGSILFTLNTLGYCFVTNMTGIYILRFMNGVTQGIYFSPPATIIADNTPEDKLVDAMSYFGIASSIAIAIAPTAGSVIYASIGPVAFFAVSSVFAALSALCCLFIKETSITRRKKFPHSSSASRSLRPIPLNSPRCFRLRYPSLSCLAAAPFRTSCFRAAWKEISQA